MKRMLRRFTVVFISNYLLFLPLINAYAAEELAFPTGDLIAPEIKSPPITKKFPIGEQPTIHAIVTDNVGVKTVTIFYRDTGAKDFQRKQMAREPGTDDYSITLPAITASGIEYYLQATDLAGNTLLHGHTFAPLTLSVNAPPGAVAQHAQVDASKEQGVNKWVWIGLGALAVGALAGGGGGGGGSTTAKSGTVKIIGPTP